MFDRALLRLVAITDDLRDGRDGLVGRAAAAVRGGATLVQLRLKDAEPRTLVEVALALVRGVPAPVVVNDRVDVALAAGAAGAHLGAGDLPVAAARAIAPPGFIIGASVGSDDEVAGAAGADYVGIGPVFATSSKDDAGSAIGVESLEWLAARCARPAVAIGGITADNAIDVMVAGVDGVAAIREIFGAPDPARAARALRTAIGR